MAKYEAAWPPRASALAAVVALVALVAFGETAKTLWREPDEGA